MKNDKQIEEQLTNLKRELDVLNNIRNNLIDKYSLNHDKYLLNYQKNDNEILFYYKEIEVLKAKIEIINWVLNNSKEDGN